MDEIADTDPLADLAYGPSATAAAGRKNPEKRDRVTWDNGISLRSKAGHCIQCDTSRIAFVMRPSEPAYVYIAGSLNREFIKIGSTTDLTTRMKLLASQAYGGASDWELLAKAFTKKAGTVEFDAQAKIDQFRTTGNYQKDGHTQESYELFRCPYSAAKKALKEALPVSTQIVVTGNEERILLHYKFKWSK